jgi:hypothetical protein
VLQIPPLVFLMYDRIFPMDAEWLYYAANFHFLRLQVSFFSCPSSHEMESLGSFS